MPTLATHELGPETALLTPQELEHQLELAKQLADTAKREATRALQVRADFAQDLTGAEPNRQHRKGIVLHWCVADGLAPADKHSHSRHPFARNTADRGAAGQGKGGSGH